MKKSFAGLLLLLATLFMVCPAAATPNLAGNWNLTITYVEPDGTVHSNEAMAMTLNATANPTLFYGTMTGGDPALQYITIMMDAGANMHFAISWTDANAGESAPHTRTYGRGTASTKKVVGSWNNDLGYSGVFTAIPAL